MPKLSMPPWLWKNFKFMVFKLLENAFESQNIESRHFHPYLPPDKTLLQVLHDRALRSVYGTFSLRMRSSRAYFS